MFKLVFGLVAALFFALPAQAVITPVAGFSCYSTSFPAWGTFTGTAKLGCAEQVTAHGKSVGSVHAAMVTACTAGIECGWGWDTAGALGNLVIRANAASICPANSTLSGGVCNCSSGYTELGGSCNPTSPTCPVGLGKTTNRTEGWARSSDIDANDIVQDLGPPSSIYGYNDGVCVGNITGVERCFRSAEPSAQGLHRISCDYTLVVTGPSTATGESNSNPAQPIASCPGFVGQVNGKTVCVGTASNPLPAGTDAPNEPTSAGNPSAGPKPATGPGSGSDGPGRTPTTGGGGNTGGPASAAVGGGGTGPRSDGTETTGEVCGASPLPPCNVKVDETGVPAEGTAAQRFQQGLTDLAQVETDAQGKITEARETDLPEWSWTFSLPTGCAPYAMEAFGLELDVCQFQPIIHDIMSFLWLSAGVFGLIALFRQSVGT